MLCWIPPSMLTACLLVLAVLQRSSAYKQFQSLIPNGGRVPNPCDGESLWQGVGHETDGGGSIRNQFGLDFLEQGKEWTLKLCRADSDGDGRSNGEELGDPDCSWTRGAAPPDPDAVITHPGICEPMTSLKCLQKNLWLNCKKTSDLQCEHIDRAKTVKHELRLEPSPVPSLETTYFCQLFDLNVTSDMHMVATEPLITAARVVHHILLFGCDPRVSIPSKFRSPYQCQMVPHDGCRSLIGAWTLGSAGECTHPETGFKMGPRGYTTIALQVHWNNQRHLSGLMDNSGLRIHLSPSLRRHDAGMLVIGQRYLQVEPVHVTGRDVTVKGKDQEMYENSDLTFTATCPSRCTRLMFTSKVYITAAVNHMHYLGKSQRIELYRNNTLVNVITDQDSYDYDDPVFYTFPKAISVEPGDELRTTCVYKRTPTREPVCWGEATSDEMCFGFITYYPLQSLSHPWCTSMNSLPSCERHLPSLSHQPISECRWWEFRDPSHPETILRVGRILHNCYSEGEVQPQLACTPDCRKAVKEVVNHPCMQGDIGSYMIDKYKLAGAVGQSFLDAVITCSCRKFRYCDTKVPQGILGSRQSDFCSSSPGLAACRYLVIMVVVSLISVSIWL